MVLELLSCVLALDIKQCLQFLLLLVFLRDQLLRLGDT